MSTLMKGLFVIACASLVACTTAVESPDPAPAPAPAAAAAPAGDVARSDADRAKNTGVELGFSQRTPQAASAFVCRKDAFCEDFENTAWSAHWSDLVTTAGGRMGSAQESASTGKGALELYAHDDVSSAFLLESKGDVGGSWSGVVSFAWRVDQIPGKYLGGPELTVKTSEGPITIRIALEPEGLVLEQLASETCRRDRCVTSSKILAPSQPGHWYRVAVGIEANAQQAAPYGRLEATVDGGDLQTTDLTVPFYAGSVFLRAGITQGDARPATAHLDDVTLLVH